MDVQVIKFIKAIVANSDDNFIKILISNNSFKKIIVLFEENREKNNLIFSAILDLFDLINKITLKKIIIHIVRNKFILFSK